MYDRVGPCQSPCAGAAKAGGLRHKGCCHRPAASPWSAGRNQERLAVPPRSIKSGAEAGSVDLPTEPTQAQRFGAARTAQSTALLEDYAELIADLLAMDGEA